MVANLVKKANLSKPLIIQNRTRSRSDQLASKLGEKTVRVVDSVQDAVKEADIIFSCVGAADSVLPVKEKEDTR